MPRNLREGLRPSLNLSEDGKCPPATPLYPPLPKIPAKSRNCHLSNHIKTKFVFILFTKLSSLIQGYLKRMRLKNLYCTHLLLIAHKALIKWIIQGNSLVNSFWKTTFWIHSLKLFWLCFYLKFWLCFYLTFWLCFYLTLWLCFYLTRKMKGGIGLMR